MAIKDDDGDLARDDSWQVLLSDRSRKLYVELSVSASGARSDGTFTYGKDKAVDRQWNGIWDSAVSVLPDAWTAELAIPWEMLEVLGLNRNQLTVDLRGTNRTGIGSAAVALSVVAAPGFADVSLGEIPPAELKTYTVRLHFAELGDAEADERTFDIKIQDRVALEDFDVVKAAGGPRMAVVKEFEGIQATDTLTIELAPGSEEVASAPVLSAVELVAQ